MSDARLWRNARVFTGRRYVEALLVEGGRVSAVGSNETVRRAAPTGVESVDLSGRLILPGLIDSHLHLADLTRSRDGLELGSVNSVKGLMARVRQWAEGHPTGAVIGRGWDAERLGRRAWPSRQELDEALASRPLVLYHASGHAAVVNSTALAAAGIDRATPDPPGGRIGRDRDGTPDGSLFEEAMRSVASIATAAHPPDPKAIARTLRFVASLGLTTVVSMNVGGEEARALRELSDRHSLAVRVRMYLRLSQLEEYAATGALAGGGTAWWSISGVKAFTDGAFGPRTAWLSVPYADAPEEVGLPSRPDSELSQGLAGAVKRGLAPALHAIGDRGVERALRLLQPFAGATAAPVRIEHAALTPPELFPLLDQVRPALGVQPGFVWSDAWLGDRLGPERARWAYVFRTLSDRGHLLAGSSDAPYDPVDPWRGIAATVKRRDPEGRSANPDPSEALPLEEAVQVYTVHGGSALGESEIGSLEPGAWGDLLVLDTSDLSRAVQQGAATVRETWIEGRRVVVEDASDSG